MNNNFNHKISKEILNAAKNKDADTLMSSLSEADRQKVQEALADKEKLKNILNSDAARQLMNFLGGKQNG